MQAPSHDPLAAIVYWRIGQDSEAQKSKQAIQARQVLQGGNMSGDSKPMVKSFTCTTRYCLRPGRHYRVAWLCKWVLPRKLSCVSSAVQPDT